MPLLFAATMFLSATLLFLVQPMIGKMTLPLLGGTPAVWNTCQVFFQGLLLLGYLYAHRLTISQTFEKQHSYHRLVLFAALAVMVLGALLSERHAPIPILKSLAPQGSSLPFFGVLLVLSVAVALPFFVLSTTAPLLQKWFSETGHPSANDPYFLYGASNFGSLLSLALYPLVLEKQLTVVQQTYVWAIGYAVLVFMILLCASAVTEAKAKNFRGKQSGKNAAANVDTPPPSMARKLYWLGLAFVPSTLMLGVTTFISTDIASLPLLWVIPLSLYLITFIIAFSQWAPYLRTALLLFAPVLVLLLVFVINSPTKPKSFGMQIGLHVITFFVLSLVCHLELARLRPKPQHLTTFYLTMSIGGMLGGLFNALVAPIVFRFITEYPLSLIIGCILMPKIISEVKDKQGNDPADTSSRFSIWDLIFPVGLFGLTLWLQELYWADSLDTIITWIAKQFLEDEVTRSEFNRMFNVVGSITRYGIPVMLCYIFVEKPVRFGLCVAAVWLAFVTFDFKVENRGKEKRNLEPNIYTRGFFGTLKIEEEYFQRRLVHGTTLHGTQFRNVEVWNSLLASSLLVGANGPCGVGTAAVWAGSVPEWDAPELKPLTYYHKTGPVGFIMKALNDRLLTDPAANTDTACIGLGTGSLSAYGKPGQKMTFFEIDTVVRNLVEPGKHFTYIKAAKERGVEIDFVMGDARLTLEKLDRKFALMFVDAFASDAIPVHLLTKEAMTLYFDRLREDGLLAIHISNRYLDLEPVVGHLADALGVSCKLMHDYQDDPDDDVFLYERTYRPGKTSSTWIVLARKPEYLGSTILDSQRPNGKKIWNELEKEVEVRIGRDAKGQLQYEKRNPGVWTDDFHSVLDILKFNPFSLWD